MTAKAAIMDMKRFAASDLKTQIGAMFMEAAREPVQITRHGTASFVLMSEERFRQLEAIEDSMWAKRAKKALKSGFVGTDKAEALLREALSAKSG